MQKEKECQFDHFKYQHYNFQFERGRKKSVSIQQEVSTKLHKLQQRRWQMFQLIAP